MKKLMQEIGQWHEETFPNASLFVIAEKLKEEAEELRVECDWQGTWHFNKSQLAEEAADVFIVLASIIHRAGIPIEREVKKKMAKNRERRWLLQPDGTYRRKK